MSKSSQKLGMSAEVAAAIRFYDELRMGSLITGVEVLTFSENLFSLDIISLN
jgi:hypothetical protein